MCASILQPLLYASRNLTVPRHSIHTLWFRSGLGYYKNPKPRKEDDDQHVPHSSVVAYFSSWEKPKGKTTSLIPREVRSYLNTVKHLIFKWQSIFSWMSCVFLFWLFVPLTRIMFIRSFLIISCLFSAFLPNKFSHVQSLSILLSKKFDTVELSWTVNFEKVHRKSGRV